MHSPGSSLVLVGLAVAGCSAHFNVPSAYEGSIAVQLANRAGESVCKFAMAPRGQAVSGDWFGFKKLLPDHTIDFKLKPDTYTVRTSSCPGGWTAKDTVVKISGPTVITVGLGKETAGIPAGFSQAFIAIISHPYEPPSAGVDQGAGDHGGAAEPRCKPDGEHGTVDECCGHHTSWTSKGFTCCSNPGYNGCSI